MMKECDEMLKKYEINLCDELFYLLLHLLNNHLSLYEDMIEGYKERDDFDDLKMEYKKFYDFVLKFLEDIDLNKELLLHQKVYEIVTYLLDNYHSRLAQRIKVYLSNILDVIFLKYRIDISQSKNNEDVRNYLVEKFKNEKIVNSMMMLLLADTSISEEYVKNISYEEFENLLTNMILLVIYMHKEVV